MRILFLSHYFPPEVNAPANRTHEHCREWAASGHEVHVVTGVPSHPAGLPFPGYRRGWYQHQEIEGIHVHRVWTHLAPNRGVLRRTLNYLSFVPTAVFRAWRLGRFDVIISTSPQFFCVVAGRITAALRGTPWVFELRDLWPESIHAVGALRTSLPLRILERLELYLYARASAVVCVTQSFIANLERRGVDSGKLRYVPNGIAPGFWAAGSRESGRTRLGVTPDQIAVTYTGTIGMAHGLGTVLQAARLLEASLPRVRFFIVGDGAELAQLKARAIESAQSNVAFTGLRPRGEMADILAASDIALVTLKPAETFKAVLPSKMFEAMAASKPIGTGGRRRGQTCARTCGGRTAGAARRRCRAGARDCQARPEPRPARALRNVGLRLCRQGVRSRRVGRSISRHPRGRGARTLEQCDVHEVCPHRQLTSEATLTILRTTMALYGLLFAFALIVSLCVTPPVRALARKAGVLDVPDGKRKLHPRPIPRLGGVAVFISFYVSLWLVGTLLDSRSVHSAFELAAAMFAPSLLILVLGIVDDKYSVGPWLKLAVQSIAGLIVYYQLEIRIDTLAPLLIGNPTMLGLLSLPATLFWIVLITNAFNVVDGMDGLATGVAFIALACMFMVSLQMNQPAIAFAAAPLAGAVLGFLRYNFHPASIFLGDSGSLFLGFQLAVLSIVGSQKSSTAVAVAGPVFVLALPLVETATSALRRWVSGRSIMQPDSAHIHHQLIRLGCTPRRAAGILYLGSGLCGLASLFVIQGGSANIGLIALSFFAVTVFGIQQLGYTEFAEINGALRRFVHQRQIIQNSIICRRLATELANASSMNSAWSTLKSAASRLGFSYVELTLESRTLDLDTVLPRYAERLLPAPGSAQQPETTFAVALPGRLIRGQVVFSRSTVASPLHSELPLLISAVAESLPRVIERSLRTSADPSDATDRPQLSGPATAEAEPQSPGARDARTICCSCGSPRVHRSHSRSSVEQLRKKLTTKRLYECASCGWRGWKVQTIVAPQTVARTFESPPDLRALDVALQNLQARTNDLRI